MRSMYELIKEANDIQNACNLCGLAQRFAKVMIELGEHTSGTDERNKHLIVTMWLDKFVSLNEYSDTKANSAFINFGAAI